MLAVADFAITVSDAKRSARWWQEAMGFDLHTVGGEEGGHALMIAPPGDRFLIHLCEGFEGVDPGNTGIAFMSDEIEAQVDRMRAAGVQFPEPLKKEEWGAMAKFADPDGNIFWLLGAPRAFIRSEVRRVGKGTRARAPAPKSPPRPARRRGSVRRR